MANTQLLSIVQMNTGKRFVIRRDAQSGSIFCNCAEYDRRSTCVHIDTYLKNADHVELASERRVATIFRGTVTCPNCWREFERGDWRMHEGFSSCYDCHAVLITATQRHAGFVESMRSVDSNTLRRWINNQYLTLHRREIAAQVLRERGEL